VWAAVTLPEQISGSPTLRYHSRMSDPKPLVLPTPEPLAPPTSIVVLTGPVISAGESLSMPLDVSAGRIFRLMMPETGWDDDAPLTFQISHNGTNFWNVCDANGVEFSVKCVPRAVLPFQQYLMYINMIKVRSGFSNSPVPQKAQRTFRLVIDTKAVANIQLV
jgi:hypothetical protein